MKFYPFATLFEEIICPNLQMVFILLHFYYCSSVRHFCGMRNSEKLAALNKLILRFTCLLNDYISYYRTLLFSEVFSISLQNVIFFSWFPTHMRNM